jgi:hypothetical protein
VLIDYAGGKVTITLKPQQQRRIALLNVPYTPVTFEYANLDEAAIGAFMKDFMRSYQRGGG